MNRMLFAAAMVAIAGSASVASANVEIGGTAGIHTFATDDELGVPDVKSAASERNSALFGLRLGVMFNEMFGIEGEFGVIPSESRQQVFDVWNITYRAHVLAQFRAADPNVKLVPFALIGGGAVSVVSSGMESVIGKDTDAEMYGGIGAKYRVDNGWGLRGDARILFPPSSQSNGVTVEFEVLLGIYKEFGRKQAEKAIEQPKGPKDSDGDGIPDDVDKCPTEAEDKDGFQDEDGCPDPDNDGDGVPDAQDKCPDKPETKNGYQDEDGCPDEVPAKVKKFTGVIEGINFKVNDATLLPGSNGVLDKAVAVLKEFGDLHMEIQGHTDDQPMAAGGKYKDNNELSQARADTVKAYFVSKGIDESRVVAKGYGDTAPIVPPADLKGGKLNAARAKNRRVEFRLTSKLTESSTGAAPAPSPTPSPTPAPGPAR
jgi:OOP family OmpA-OmpF porin